MTAVARVDPGAWRSTVADALAAGERFAGAWASRDGGEPCWRALLASTHTVRVVWTPAPDGVADSIVDLAPAADWDEREAHDLHGLRFPGHEPLRALVTHTPDPAGWMTPVSGDGVHQVAVGPIHAGVIESGHFRFHVVGERILAMDPRLFYKHRGLERAAEGASCERAIAHVQRACAACAVANTVAYAHAVEDAAGLRPDRELRTARTVLLELERVYNHLHDIGAICAGVGLAAGTMAFAALKDRAQEINARAFGHRFLFGTVAAGGAAAALDGARTETLRDQLGALRADVVPAWRELGFSGSLQARLGGVGVLAREDALRLGAVGPAARACGVREDVRSVSPRLAYDGFTPATLAAAAGDVAARLELRALELEASFELLTALLGRPLAGGCLAGGGDRGEIGVGRVESPRGATACVVELDGDRVGRVHLRTASYANWPALAHATAGNLVPDFPLINKSFELCYACVDR
ncbi:MAG: NADH-quinone oxidoreductase subunit C [Solirubrobacteraceae bacterium]